MKFSSLLLAMTFTIATTQLNLPTAIADHHEGEEAMMMDEGDNMGMGDEMKDDNAKKEPVKKAKAKKKKKKAKKGKRSAKRKKMKKKKKKMSDEG